MSIDDALRETPEVIDVERAIGQIEPIAAINPDDLGRRPQQATQTRDMTLERRPRRRWLFIAPERIAEPINRDDHSTVRRQHRQKNAQFGTERSRILVVADRDRPEDPYADGHGEIIAHLVATRCKEAASAAPADLANPATPKADNNDMTSPTVQTDPVTVNPNQALWEKGDFTQLAATMRRSGEALAADLGVTKNMDVLDVGCGDGTTAVPSAQLGATVLGVDIARNLVAAGNARAENLGLVNLTFEHGDASNLSGIADGRFDLVVSIFGAMFAPRPFDVAKELVRVAKPGGRIVMGNWIPGDPTLVAQVLKISAAYTPAPPEGFVSPVTWGVAANVIERFTAAGISPAAITCEPRTYTFEYPGQPVDFLTVFRDFYGPTMNAYAAASASGREADLHAELSELFRSQNTAATNTMTTIPATYLHVTVHV